MAPPPRRKHIRGINEPHVEPMKYIDPCDLKEKMDQEIEAHSREVYDIFTKYSLYTPAKLVPSALVTEHHN